MQEVNAAGELVRHLQLNGLPVPPPLMTIARKNPRFRGISSHDNTHGGHVPAMGAPRSGIGFGFVPAEPTHFRPPAPAPAQRAGPAPGPPDDDFDSFLADISSIEVPDSVLPLLPGATAPSDLAAPPPPTSSTSSTVPAVKPLSRFQREVQARIAIASYGAPAAQPQHQPSSHLPPSATSTVPNVGTPAVLGNAASSSSTLPPGSVPEGKSAVDGTRDPSFHGILVTPHSAATSAAGKRMRQS